MSLKPKVALSQDFLGQLAKISSAIQGKILKWAIKFQADPTDAGTNYEKINGARDDNLRSVRIDQDWRGIVFKPKQGDVYVLLYVDHHDEAYSWAVNRKIAVNPVTGAMQVVVLTEVAQTTSVEAAVDSLSAVEQTRDAPAPALFADLTDQDLLALGTPEALLPNVRVVHSEADLDAIQAILPLEAYEGLFLVAAGDSVNQILGARETRVDKVIDTEDFVTSLQTPESQSRFVLVSDDAALASILNAPLSQWRVFLHPTQNKLAVGDRSGPMRVLGGAGTGKTVLAMHRAKWLAENRCPADKKVLFTTFTKNLATDIEDNLKTLCSAATMEKIEVKNLDAWVHAFLRSQKYEHSIVYNRKEGAAHDAWQVALALKNPALSLDDRFYEEELEQVVLAQGVTTLDEYRMARRSGRGVTLTRAKRDGIWPVFEEYRLQLAARKLKEVDDAYRDAALQLANVPMITARYASIVVDETQDFGPQALRLLRALVPPARNDLFFVGDGHQRIYTRNRAAMSRCGIAIQGRSRKLYINYRTTEEIRRQAVALLEGIEIDDLDEGLDEDKRYKSLSHGPKPIIERAETMEQAFEWLKSQLLPRMEVASDRVQPAICVITATTALRDQADQYLRKAGFETHVIEANGRDSADRKVVRLATMHRAKGLEFDCVIVLATSSQHKDTVRFETQQKLIYVALTRAKKDAVLLWV